MALAAILTVPLLTSAQEAPRPAGVRVAPGQPVPGQPGAPGQPVPGQPQPGQPTPPGGEPKKDDGKPAAPAPVTRGPKPTTPAPSEITARPGPDGKVQINFHGQKWLDVLEWYAEISSMSLDWQEVPGDYLNLRTQRTYSLEELRDLLNRHLMDRGYTLLRHGEVLIVANLKKLDPALVPRVRPDELADREDHEFVKVSFKLDWLIAESTVEELKPMLSPNGKLTGLKATNRLEAIDAVVNLREIAAVLGDEQSNRGQDRLVREFKLQYTRAEEVYDLLLGLLGQEKPKKEEGPMNPQQMMRMQQMMQQQQGQPQPGGAQKEKLKVHLVVNKRDNSLLANGPPDLIALCEQAVKTLDVPNQDGSSLLQNPNRMQVYRLTAIDPEPLVEVLNQLGNLDPQTQLKVDKKNRAILVYAPLADHMTIRTLVDKLDGSDRRFEVIRLRKLEADYVAGTIQFMMGQAEQKQQNRRSSYYYFDPFEAMSGRESGSEDQRKFRVDADVEHNRLLIWASEVELAEINKLLVKLGEIPPPGFRGSTMRTIDSIAPEDATELLDKLRKSWPGVGPNPLELKLPKSLPSPSDSPSAPRRPVNLDDRSTDLPKPQPSFHFSRASVSRTHEQADDDQAVAEVLNDLLVSEGVEEEPAPPLPESATTTAEADDAEELSRTFPRRNPQAGASPPVRLELSADGRWIVQCDDPAVLDQLEDLISELAPPRRDYKLFQLKHSTTWAYGIALTLEEFFKETEKQPKNNRPPWYYDYGGSSNTTQEETRRLSKRRPMKFISDSDSNTILVVGADPSQLRTIEELINVYDQALPSDEKAVRKTRMFSIKYSRARAIADTIKDVYRDLLSENDKALQEQQQQKQQQQSGQRTITYNYGDGDDKAKAPTPLKFKGALSVGVDEISNTLVISANDTVMDSIVKMVDELDLAAKPTVPTFQALRLDNHIPSGEIQEKLVKLLRESRRRDQPQQKQQPQNNQPQQPQQVIIDDF